MSVHRLLTIILRWSPLILAGLLLAVPAYLYANSQRRVYEASTTLLVGEALTGTSPDYNGLQVSQYLTGTYALMADSPPVMGRVIERLGLEETPGQLADRVRATATEGDALVTITVQDGDPARAAALADAVAVELVAASPGSQGREAELQASIEQDLDALREEITAVQTDLDRLLALSLRTPGVETETTLLRDRLLTLRSTFAALVGYSRENASNRLTVIQPAVEPTGPVAPRPLYLTLVAAAAGLMLAAALAFLLEYLRDRIRGPEDVEGTVALSLLAGIPWRRRRPRAGSILRTWEDARSPAAEAFRALRANIEFATAGHELRTLLVASPRPDEGRTTTAANLAVAFALAGRRVLLVDADLRRPRLATLFGTGGGPGLTSLLLDDSLAVADVARPTRVPGMHLLTAGPAPAPASWPSPGTVRSLQQRLMEAADLVIYDTPPMDRLVDAAVLAADVDAVLLVLRNQHTTRASLRDAVAVLTNARANLIGIAAYGMRVRLGRTHVGDPATTPGGLVETPPRAA